MDNLSALLYYTKLPSQEAPGESSEGDIHISRADHVSRAPDPGHGGGLYRPHERGRGRLAGDVRPPRTLRCGSPQDGRRRRENSRTATAEKISLCRRHVTGPRKKTTKFGAEGEGLGKGDGEQEAGGGAARRGSGGPGAAEGTAEGKGGAQVACGLRVCPRCAKASGGEFPGATTGVGATTSVATRSADGLGVRVRRRQRCSWVPRRAWRHDHGSDGSCVFGSADGIAARVRRRGDGDDARDGGTSGHGAAPVPRRGASLPRGYYDVNRGCSCVCVCGAPARGLGRAVCVSTPFCLGNDLTGQHSCRTSVSGQHSSTAAAVGQAFSGVSGQHSSSCRTSVSGHSTTVSGQHRSPHGAYKPQHSSGRSTATARPRSSSTATATSRLPASLHAGVLFQGIGLIITSQKSSHRFSQNFRKETPDLPDQNVLHTGGMRRCSTHKHVISRLILMKSGLSQTKVGFISGKRAVIPGTIIRFMGITLEQSVPVPLPSVPQEPQEEPQPPPPPLLRRSRKKSRAEGAPRGHEAAPRTMRTRARILLRSAPSHVPKAPHGPTPGRAVAPPARTRTPVP